MRLIAVRPCFALVLAAAAPVTAQTPAPGVSSSNAARAMLDEYCVTCHNDRMKANFGNLSLQDIRRSLRSCRPYIPHMNLLLTTLGRAGVNGDGHGDSTGTLKEIVL